MNFVQTYNRGHLQTLCGKHKRDALKLYIESEITDQVLRAARGGKTSFFHVEDPTVYNRMYSVFLTREEIMDALRSKFPECTVSYGEMWVEVRTGTKELKKGIVVDWS
jgi:hypothetical protein